MPSIEAWALFLVSTFIQWGFVITNIHVFRRFYKYRHHHVIQKRYPLLVYLINVTVTLYVGFRQTFTTLAYIHDVSDDQLSGFGSADPNVWLGTMLQLLSLIFYAFSLHGAIIVIVSRTWLIYYNIKWSQQRLKYQHNLYSESDKSQSPTQNSQNCEKNKTSKSWFIAHKKKLGTHRTIYKYNIVYYIVEAVVLLALFVYNQTIALFLDGTLYLIELGFLIIIWTKIPKFVDILGIKREIQLVIRLLLFGVLWYGSWIMIDTFGSFNLWLFMLYRLTVGILVANVAIIFNSYIFRSKYNSLFTNVDTQNALSNHININITETDKHVKGGSALTVRTPVHDESTNSAASRYSLPQTLADESLVAAFFKHLSDEFSTELLLSFVEFTQFRQILQMDLNFMRDIADVIAEHNENMDSDIHTQNDEELQSISLNRLLTKSEINLENDSESDSTKKYLLIVKDIWSKYICIGSEFEINISTECRLRIHGFVKENCNNDHELDKNGLYQMYNLFEECRKHVYGLMLLSHERFIATMKSDREDTN